MSKTARRPQRIYQIVLWLLSIIFAAFLVRFGGLVLRDLPKVGSNIQRTDFISQTDLDEIDKKKLALEVEINAQNRLIEDKTITVKSAQADYQSAYDAFDNWIKTRGATEVNASNPEVVARTRELDVLKDTERAAERDVEAAQNTLIDQQRRLKSLKEQREGLFDDVEKEYQKARRWQSTKIFALRLAVTLPLLVVAAWILLRKRESAYWPLYRGFVLFALFAFFVELVPYLPYYGGYIRYGVGLIIIILAGHFLIKAMRNYLARKQVEESRSEPERRQSIAYETALKKISDKTCPGCDRALIVREDAQTDFCPHCGIKLHTNCQSCNTRNISFHRFCLSCGTPSEEVSHAAT